MPRPIHRPQTTCLIGPPALDQNIASPTILDSYELAAIRDLQDYAESYSNYLRLLALLDPDGPLRRGDEKQRKAH